MVASEDDRRSDDSPRTHERALARATHSGEQRAILSFLPVVAAIVRFHAHQRHVAIALASAELARLATVATRQDETHSDHTERKRQSPHHASGRLQSPYHAAPPLQSRSSL